MGIKLLSTMFSFLLSCLLIFGIAYCFLKYFLKKKKSNTTKNRSNPNPSNNIIHVNYPNTDSPFYVQNNEVVHLPIESNNNQNETNIGWRPEVVPNAPIQNDLNQPPPPYSSIVKEP